jgi:hypothetical protein
MYKLTSIFFIFILIGACNSPKQKIENNSSGNKTDTLSRVKKGMANLIEEKLIKEGYQLGTVKNLENTNCPFVIYSETTNNLLDPINFEASDFAEFKKNELKIYFQYRALRMMNRCNEASPIELTSIRKRED